MSEELANQSAGAHWRNTRHQAILVIFEPNPVAIEELARWEKLGIWQDMTSASLAEKITKDQNTIRPGAA